MYRHSFKSLSQVCFPNFFHLINFFHLLTQIQGKQLTQSGNNELTQLPREQLTRLVRNELTRTLNDKSIQLKLDELRQLIKILHLNDPTFSHFILQNNEKPRLGRGFFIRLIK